MTQENIDVTVRLADQLSRPAGRAEESIEDLRDEVRGLNRDLAAAQAETARQERALAALQAQTRRSTRATSQQRDTTGRFTRSQRDSTTATQASTNAMGRFDRVMSRVNNTLGALGKSLGLLKFAALLSVLPLAITLLSQLGAGAIAVVAGLAPLAGLLGAIPGVIGAFALAMVAAKVGLKGVSDGFKVLQDPAASPEKVAEAMNDLTSSGRVLAQTLDAFADGPLRRLRNATQEAIAPRLTSALTLVSERLMPTLSRRVVEAGTVLGDLANSAASTYSTPLFRGELARTLDSSLVALENGGRAAITFSTAVAMIGAAFAPVLVLMSEGALRASQWIAATVQMGRDSGGLTAFFRRAWDTAKGVWGVLKDVGSILYDVGKQGMDAARELGGGLGDVIDKFRTFVGSAEGQQQIRDWFESAIPTIRAVGTLFVTLGQSLGGLAAEGSEVTGSLQGITDVLPGLGDLLGGVLASAAALTEAVVDAAGKIVERLSPAVEDVVNDVLTRLVPALNDVVPPMIDVGETAVAAASALAPLVSVIGPLAAVLKPVGDLFNLVGDGLDALPGPIATAVVAITGLTVVLRFFSGSALATAITGIGSSIQVMGAKAAAAATSTAGLRLVAGGMFTAMGGPWGLAIAGVIGALALWGGASRKTKAEQEKLKQQVDSVRESLDQQTGALTTNTREMIKKTLLDSGAYDAARELGVNLEDVTEAALGNADALARINDETALLRGLTSSTAGKYGKDNLEVQRLFETLDGAIGGTSTSIREARDDLDLLAQAGDGAGAGLGKAKVGTDGLTDAQRRGIAEFTQYQAQQKAARIEAEGLATATNQTVTALTTLNNVMLKNTRSYVGFRQTVADSAAKLEETTHTLDLNTQAGRDNALALADVAESAANVTNQAQRKKAIAEATALIRQWGIDAGWSTRRANKYADSFFNLGEKARKVPKKVAIDVKASGFKYGEVVDNMRLLNERTRKAKENNKVRVDVTAPGLDPATQGVKDFKTELDKLPDRVPVKIDITRQYLGNPPASDSSIPYYLQPNLGPVGANASGGAVGAGATSLVNEFGPELFVPRSGGAPSVLGGGPSIQTFSEPGYIVPAAGTPAAIAKPIPGWVEARLADTVEANRPQAAPALPASQEGSGGGAGVITAPPIHQSFSGTDLTPDDVKRAALEAWREFMREQEERR